jgi:hypothetical protein
VGATVISGVDAPQIFEAPEHVFDPVQPSHAADAKFSAHGLTKSEIDNLNADLSNPSDLGESLEGERDAAAI